MVAVATSFLPQLRLRQKTQAAHGSERHVFERQLHMLAHAPAPPMPLRRQQPCRSHLAGDEVPGRQHMVDGRFGPAAASEIRQAHAGVDRVVHG
ncbi:hypothetical protein D3C86_1867200 [compost metagenome]